MTVTLEITKGRVFIDQMPNVKAATLIGSASYLPGEAQDVDFAVLLSEGNALEYAGGMLAAGWALCGDYDNTNGAWCAVRAGNINLMLTHDPKFYDGYLRATEVAKYFRLTDKNDRIAVCRIVRDGLTAAEAKGAL